MGELHTFTGGENAGVDRRKVAILGFAESYKEAPFQDPTVEIWGLNELYKYIPRWNRWFEIHDEETLGVTTRDATAAEQQRHLEWLRAQPVGQPIYMQRPFCDGRFPAAVPFPLDELIARFYPDASKVNGRWDGAYLTSTPAMMLAMAIAERYPWIGIYGIDLASDVEYLGQRPCMEYLIGLARGLGITVTVPRSAALLRAGHIYGFERPLGDSGGITIALIRDRIRDLKTQHERTLATLQTLDGATQEAQNMLKILLYKERGAWP
jgi:hypothetical protein